MDTNNHEEMFDVVDENDNVIGIASRSECHSNPRLIHRTIHFTLANKTNNTVLITQRSFKKTHDAGKLCFLGEHILSGETYTNALIRGVTEELGFTPTDFIECAKKIFRYDSQTELIKFFLVFYDNQELIWDRNELESISWISCDDLVRNVGYSDMTSYWIKTIDWKKILSQNGRSNQSPQ